tara:strand:+ start:401 stop:676 length:276 start_codon:yes stop_codon:yes gene_type:complete
MFSWLLLYNKVKLINKPKGGIMNDISWAARIDRLVKSGITIRQIQDRVGCTSVETVRRWRRGDGGPSGLYKDKFEQWESEINSVIRKGGQE